VVRAFVLGGSGQVGRAISRRLIAAGWDVDVVGRDRARVPADLLDAGVRFFPAERDDDASVAAAFGDGADLVVDCVCFTAGHANSLLPLARHATSTVMISAKAVYADAVGRHANSDDAPQFDGPIRETQATVPAGDMDFMSRDGYGRNKVAAERVLLDSGLPVTVLRAGKIHGEGARPPREWIFVKRVLDRRSVVLLAHRGGGIDQPTAAVNLAALVETVAAEPGRRILNSADPDAPSGRQIARTVAQYLDHQWEEVLLDAIDEELDDSLGHHPWDQPYPVVLDTTAAVELGYTPVGDYASTVRAEIDWLAANAGSSGRAQLPTGYEDPAFDGMFDYAREDRFLAGRSRPRT
jgi:nucleoside-diphosphate-sugar epimerase